MILSPSLQQRDRRRALMIRGKTILLTGGAGFIGSTLAARLVEHNRVVVFDNGHRNSIKDTPLLSIRICGTSPAMCWMRRRSYRLQGSNSPGDFPVTDDLAARAV